jgi:putative oxidoreductase
MNLNATALAGRVLLAAVFLLSGLGKVFSPHETQAYIAQVGLPLPALALVVAIVVEIGAGTFLALGYKTRFAAIILAVFAVLTALLFHADIGDQNQLVHALKNVAIAGGLLQLAAFGPGTLSLDARRSTATAIAAG